MTTHHDPFTTASGDPDGERARERRHAVLAELLSAYADQELPAETASQIDAHLLGCARCRHELALHLAVRDRLAVEPTPAVPAALASRIASAIDALATPAAESGAARVDWRHSLWVTWSGWAVAAVLALMLASGIGAPRPRAPSSRSPGELAGATATSIPIPMVEAAIANYRAVMAGDLPGRARDLAAVRAAMPFSFEPMNGADIRLLAAWTTDIRGEPAAALAYRWGDRVVVQYVVSEQLFFRNPTVRQAVAASRRFTTVRGAQSVLAWPEHASGTLLVGDGPPDALVRLHDARDGR
jgi:anti-sigma factor RsiW